ncbi:uncharacterized protein LOC108673826 isoform X2 [Hyalella azteca]|uniref:Gamma-aminobutyric acid receptor subunit beta n=1 Tax=Hyalella azteca TaxID=294128 RepID=A0A979FLB9_HYAAZ|nr:uncharacterized protein LOC108673826 isoform X2 [Hyalella azteca]
MSIRLQMDHTTVEGNDDRRQVDELSAAKWLLKCLAQPIQKKTACQVSSKIAGEGITKLKFERWRRQNEIKHKNSDNSFIRYKIHPTFPTIFSHFKLIVTCLALYLFIIGPFVRIPNVHNPCWSLTDDNDWTPTNEVFPSTFFGRTAATKSSEHCFMRSGLLLAEAFSSTYNAKDFSRNVTQLLDSLLANYDKRIRPGFGGTPTKIMVNMNVRSMGPFSEKLEEYSMQLYMRQVWYDTRLKFNKTDLGRSEFSMNWMFAKRIWKPDTFFINGKKSYAHAITAPNLFVRLQYDGQVYMSMRLTVRASCVMHLRKFPLDTQTCPLRISSYGYDAKNVTYMWDTQKYVTVDSDVSIAQYELFHISTYEAVVPVRRIEEISTLTVKFHLMRLTGFFMLQVYVPCILIVCSSWVGFWITKKDAPGRVCLGVNNVLCMTKLGFGGRDLFPLVPYPTALDYFVLLCFWFTFATMIEYAGVNYSQRYAVASLNLLKKRQAKLREEEEYVAKLAREGAGCIKVIPSVHTSLLESFKVHLTAFPAASSAANTEKPKPDPKAKLLQALKLPLSMVPKVADEAAQKVRAHTVEVPPFDHQSQEHLSASKSGSESSLAPKHTPKLLQRLHVLQRRLSAHDIDETASQVSSTLPSPQPSHHPSLQGMPMFGRPLPSPPILESSAEGLPGSTETSSTIRESPSQAPGSSITDQATPSLSPRLSSLSSLPSSAGLVSPTITTTPPLPEDPVKSPPPGTPSAEATKPQTPVPSTPVGTVIKIESDPPPPPPPVKQTITVWQLLVRKKMLMKNMTPACELPCEEDLLDRFSVIDLYSRRIFPTLFFILFSIYWILFNYYITDEFPGEKMEAPDGLVN